MRFLMPTLTDRAGVTLVSQIAPGSSRSHRSGRTRKSCRGHPGLTDRAGVTLVSQIASGSPWSHRSRRARLVRREGEREGRNHPPARFCVLSSHLYAFWELRPEEPEASILTSAGLLWKALGSKPAPGAKSIDFDVDGCIEGTGIKTGPGGLKASILTSAGLPWKALDSKPAPGLKALILTSAGLPWRTLKIKLAPEN